MERKFPVSPCPRVPKPVSPCPRVLVSPVRLYTALSLNNLAFLYQDQGKLDAAEPLLERALAICEQSLGPEHPNTITGRENLAALRGKMGG